MTAYILTLDEIEPHDPTLAGGKAANVAELRRAGLRVPAGFVVTTAAYRAFVEADNLQARILALAREARADDPASVHNASQAIRRLFDQALPPQSVIDAISEAYRDLSQNQTSASDSLPPESANPFRRRQSADSLSAYPLASVAVRSSATAEDLAGASFAGQYDTYLNVRGAEAVIEKVRTCWASLWSERAIAYRQNNGLDHEAVSMAVLVQQQLPAEVAGVLFTLNPMTGREEEMTVEASWGLGEGIVSGRVTPDNFVIDAEQGQVISRRINDKRVMVALAADGTREADVPDEQRRAPALTDEQLLALTELGYRVMAHYGHPQDIEWALVAGQFHILQARPLTSFGFAPDIGQWTSANFREVMTGVVNPLSYSICFGYEFDRTLEAFFRRMNLKRDDRPVRWSRLFFSRPYMNVAEVKRYAAIIPGFKERSFDRTVGVTPTYEGDGRVTPWNPRTILRAVPVLLSLRWLYATAWRRARDYCHDFLNREATLLVQIDPATLSDDELVEWVKTIINVHHQTNTVALTISFLCTQAQDEFDPQVEQLNEALEAGGRPERINAGNLLTGLREMRTARPLVELWHLADQALREPEVAAAICVASPEEMGDQLRRFEAGQVFWGLVQAYLRRFQYMSDNDENLATPRWGEDPTFVLTTLKGFVEGGVEKNPEARLAEQREVRRQEEAKARRLLSEGTLDRVLPLRRWLFQDALRQVQRYSWWREETRDILARAHYHAHRFLTEQGRRWAGHGIFTQADDIFWLEREHVLNLLDGRLAPETARDIVARNRRKAQCHRNFEPPEAIYAGVPVHAESGGRQADTRFEGVACSSGVVTGRARVIRDLRQADRFQQGEILVAPYTNPGWTPLFSMAAGIVMEEGGLMSHGAVVARECGIPAVLQIDDATKLFRDGDLLRVDGTVGVVEVVERKGAAGTGGNSEELGGTQGNSEEL
jgi:pyruvate,water dikinase